jgi:hypothetical protein
VWSLEGHEIAAPLGLWLSDHDLALMMEADDGSPRHGSRTGLGMGLRRGDRRRWVWRDRPSQWRLRAAYAVAPG